MKSHNGFFYSLHYVTPKIHEALDAMAYDLPTSHLKQAKPSDSVLSRVATSCSGITRLQSDEPSDQKSQSPANQLPRITTGK